MGLILLLRALGLLGQAGVPQESREEDAAPHPVEGVVVPLDLLFALHLKI